MSDHDAADTRGSSVQTAVKNFPVSSYRAKVLSRGPVFGNTLAGLSVRCPHAEAPSHFRVDGGDHAGARNRSEYDDLQCAQYSGAGAVALPRSGSFGSSLGN